MRRGDIAMALPKHLNPDRMMRLALTCFSKDSNLRQCTPVSIISSLVIASQLGLEPGVGGQGYLVPYKDTCTFVPGWQGLVGLLNNSGRATAWTNAVFEGDVFEFELGAFPKLRHVPGPNYGDPDKMTWAYACAKVNGSELPVIEAWPVERLLKHRKTYNKVGSKHYSYGNWEAYCRKVVLLQVLKYMPKSVEVSAAIDASHAADEGRSIRIEDDCVIDVEASETPPPPSGGDPVDPFADPGSDSVPAAGSPVKHETLL